MREILFRGKQRVNGEWVYGDFMHGNERKSLRDSIFVYDSETQSFDNYVIDSSTIGQYTGLTDKNGKKIFEGDIIKYKNTDGIKFNGVALTVIGKVVYNEKNASFAISGKDEIGAKHYDYFPIKNIEVIGNIHDNPELMKGGDGNG